MNMTDPAAKVRPGNLLRIIVCLMSFGFVFPNALMETMDAERLAARERIAAAEEASRKS
jgi:hypothetical protein